MRLYLYSVPFQSSVCRMGGGDILRNALRTGAATACSWADTLHEAASKNSDVLNMLQGG
jgi:hypothetical protein